MIYFIKGILYEVKTNSVILESNGIGYEIFCPLDVISKLSMSKNNVVFIYTHLVHKEDSMTLYGFLDEKNKNGFLGLQKVSGIGPKQALKILSHFTFDQIFTYIQKEDIDSLTRIPGIGPKMAKKIIFDLKGVIPESMDNDLPAIEKELVSALVNLGYKENDIIKNMSELKPFGNQFETEFKRLLKKMSGKK